MNIGFMQFAPAFCNVEKTIRNIDKLIVQCKGADIVVLPELCNSGYNFGSREIAWEGSEDIANRAPGKNQEKKLTFFRQNSTIPVKAGF